MRRALSLTALAIAGLLSFGAPSPASAVDSLEVRNARYCELFELKGEIPNARLVIWNTIGLNRCPPAKWEALDTAALAVELGDKAVVKNGPRRFLMDSVSGTTGRTRSFDGLRMRKVTRVPIDSEADLVSTPYVERTVERRNTWSWNRGRRVFELLAPDGSNYVMQSYSLADDPSLTVHDMRSLGERLDLPEGWSFRSRRLRRDLDLAAHGDATIVQDDLHNTYQLVPSKADASPPKRHLVDVTGITRTVGSPAPGVVEDRGTISGPPFGSGSVDLEVTLAAGTATGKFRIDAPRGAALGTLAMDYTISGGAITFDGTATFTGGTGAYRGIRGTVAAHDHNTLDGQSGTFTLDGFARY